MSAAVPCSVEDAISAVAQLLGDLLIHGADGRGVDLGQCLLEPRLTALEPDAEDDDDDHDAAGRGGRVAVTIARDDEGMTVLEISDDGPGVPIEHRGDVFRLGFSTKSDDRQRGYGLTLVARVVERRGGTIDLSPAALGGARFVVRLPVRDLAGAAR